MHRGLLVEPDNCHVCVLRGVCKRVPPEGDVHAKIAMVGLGPGIQEEIDHKLFVGRSGQLLNQLLTAAGLRREEIWLTNAAMSLPRPMRVRNGGIIPKAKVEKQSIAACRSRLLRELAVVQPKVVVAIGAQPMEALCDDVHGMTRLVGSLLPITRDAGFEAIVIPSFHPAHLLRGEQRFFPVVVSALKKAKRLAVETPPAQLGNLFIIDPVSATIDRDLDQLDALVDDVVRSGEDIAVDVETTDATPLDCDLTVVGFGSLVRKLGVAITVRTWVPELGRFVIAWTVTQWRRVNAIIAKLLAGSNTKIYHNYGFDVSVLERFYVIGGAVRDTMILHHLAWPDVLHGLDFVVQYYLDVPPWKYYFRKGEERHTGTHRDLLIYNAQDSLYTVLVFPHVLRDATERGNLHIEEHQLAMADMARRAHLRGLPVDLQRWESSYAEHLAKRDAALAILRNTISTTPEAFESFTHSMKKRRYTRAVANGKVCDEATILPLSESGLSKERKAELQQGKLLSVDDWNPNSGDHGSWYLYELLRLVPTKFTSGGAEKDETKKVASSSYKGVLVYMADPRVKAYVDRAEEEAVLRRLREFRDGINAQTKRYHPQWNATSQKNTRFTSKKNVQNLDKTLKRIFYQPPNRRWVAADLAQVEYRIAAFLAGITELLTLFNAPPYDENNPDEKWKKFSKDYDAHSLIAEEVFQDLFRLGTPEVQAALRTMVKRVVYALFYGAFPEKIYTTILEDHRVPSSFRKFVSLEYIERIHTGFAARFPEWNRWADQQTMQVRFHSKQVFPPFNRVRFWAMSWMIEETKLRNTPVQGAAGDVFNCMIRKMDEEIRAAGYDSTFVIHGHDACVWDTAEEVVPQVLEIVNRCMDTWLQRVDERTGREVRVHIYGQAKASRALEEV